MPRAIIVEPDESIRRLQAMILRQHGGADEIVERTSLAAAIDVFSRENFDFAMISVSNAGAELREFLHISRKKQRSPVIAFTSGELSRDTLHDLVNDHVFAVFPKPFELEEVASSVRAAVEAKSAGTLYPRFYGFLRRRHE